MSDSFINDNTENSGWSITDILCRDPTPPFSLDLECQSSSFILGSFDNAILTFQKQEILNLAPPQNQTAIKMKEYCSSRFRVRKIKKTKPKERPPKKPMPKKQKRRSTREIKAERARTAQEKQIQRDIRKWYRRVELLYFLSEFVNYQRQNGQVVCLQKIENKYYNSDLRKSDKYFIHFWYSLIEQGLGQSYTQFLKLMMESFEQNVKRLYQDKSQLFHETLLAQIKGIQYCMQQCCESGNILKLVYEMYQVEQDKNVHETKRENALECLKELEKLFPTFEMLNSTF